MYCEFPEFFSVIDRAAAKDHSCCECQGVIGKGESYVSCTGKWTFGIKTYKQHQHCAELCRAFRDHGDIYEGCIPFGGLFDELCDTFSARKRYSRRMRTALARCILKSKKIKDYVKDWVIE